MTTTIEANYKNLTKLTEQRTRNSSGSTASSTMSTTSASSANSSLHCSLEAGPNRIASTLNENFSMSANFSPSNELIFHDVQIIFPNGVKTVKKIDSRYAMTFLFIYLYTASKY